MRRQAVRVPATGTHIQMDDMMYWILGRTWDIQFHFTDIEVSEDILARTGPISLRGGKRTIS